MALNEGRKKTLRQRYGLWGVDAVRGDLRRPGRDVFVCADTNEFANDWADEADLRKQGRKDKMIKGLMVAAAVEFGVAVGLHLPI